MQLGLKNRLRLISLLPILVLFSLTSYYVFNSYIEYQAAQDLKNKLIDNKKLDDLITNIALEHSMNAIYLGSPSDTSFNLLEKQRVIIDNKIAKFSQTSQEHKLIKVQMQKILQARDLLKLDKVVFKIMCMDYSISENNLISQLSQITNKQIDKEINELYAFYLSLVYVKQFSSIERAYLSYVIAKEKSLSMDNLNKWVSIIGRSDAINYETIHNKDLKHKLDNIFKNKKYIKLSQNINKFRTVIVASAGSGNYSIEPSHWFDMQSMKIDSIIEAQNKVLDAINERVRTVQESSLNIFLMTLAIWIIAIIFGALGYLLSNEIANNIKHLEELLRGASHGSKEDSEHINLHTTTGTKLAYELLENIILETKKDKEYALEVSQAKSMFLANMSHEIRTPLNGIVGFTQLLKETNLKNEQIEFVNTIEKSSLNLLDIIKNILDISKIESNKHEVEDTVFDPIEEFQSAVDVYAVKASEKNINMACYIDPSLEVPLRGDPTKIKEVLINLISNAIKFTDTNGNINIHIRKKESFKPGTTKIYFAVEDNGIGITSAQQETIFEAFSQADLSITRKYGGTGLGLTISSNFIELMGGKLELVSLVGDGTTFFFQLIFKNDIMTQVTDKSLYSDLNIAILHDSKQTKEQNIYILAYLDFYGVKYRLFKNLKEMKEINKVKTYNMIFIDIDYINNENVESYSNFDSKLVIFTKASNIKNIHALNLDIFKILYDPIHTYKIKELLNNYVTEDKKDLIQVEKKTSFDAHILIAEDNEINQKLIQRVLETFGLSVSIASDGLEAFEKAKENKYDLIFMDIQMPVMDGIEATQKILDFEQNYKIKHTPIIALTANALDGDKEKFLANGFDEYTTKPLVRDEIINILNKYLN